MLPSNLQTRPVPWESLVQIPQTRNESPSYFSPCDSGCSEATSPASGRQKTMQTWEARKGGRGRDCPLEFRPWHGNRVIWARHEPQTCCCQCHRLLHSSNGRNFGNGNVAHPQEFDCGCLRALRRLPTSNFKFYKPWMPFSLKEVILRSEELNHIPSSTVAHEVQDLFQTHVSIQWHSTPRRRGCLRVDDRSASCFGLLYSPQPRLILCILAPNLRRRTQSHNTGSNSRNPDEVDPEGTPLPEKRFAYVTQRN